MRILKTILAASAMILLTACPGSKDGDSEIDFPKLPGEGGDPGSVTLVFPENNSECTEGVTANNLQSTITFQWEASENTDSYEVNIKNLESNETIKTDSNVNDVEITLDHNTPYEWFVISKKEGSEAQPESAKWKFYNAGAGVENYAPFPADAIAPTRGQTIGTTTSVDLQWEGNDVDNDIEGFEVFFGTNDNPTTSLGTTPQSSMNANVNSGQTYYWRVTTKDKAGNSAQSEVFDFRVQ
ncbi:hypothetical protein [Maribacter halichondriae]|uniref:hypothetical protein n=1 Tax=Maribacter halichondriae TaxID=2980554 RepID=UPI0023589E85|nr:hypothetical protein [Maribacter sp. Hal144]